MLHLTHHAIEQFASRWRSELTTAEAKTELQSIAQEATATRRRTPSGDGQIYVSTSIEGEKIALVVRDGVVITVLPEGSGNTRKLVDQSIDVELYEESQDDLRAMQSMLAEERRQKKAKVEEGLLTEKQRRAAEKERLASVEADRQRRDSAEGVLRAWKNGQRFKPKALANAHKVLGLVYVPSK